MTRFLLLLATSLAIHAQERPDCLALLRTPIDIQAHRGFPAPENIMASMALDPARHDAEIRAHAWELLSLVTRPVAAGCTEAIWESWANRGAAFRAPDPSRSNKSPGGPVRILETTAKIQM